MPLPSSIAGFTISCKQDRSAATATISYWDTTGFKHEIKLPVVAAWVNPKNKLTIRAHFRVFPWLKDQREFFIGLDAHEGGLPHTLTGISEELTMQAHSNTSRGLGERSLIRFGFKGRAYPYHDAETGQTLAYFTCKQLLVKEFLEYLRQWNPIAGITAVDFSMVADEWLEELGAIKLPDILGQSVPMWMADFGWIIRQERGKMNSYDLGPPAKVLINRIKQLVEQDATPEEQSNG